MPSGFFSSKAVIFVLDVGRRDEVVAGFGLTGATEICALNTMDGVAPLPQKREALIDLMSEMKNRDSHVSSLWPCTVESTDGSRSSAIPVLLLKSSYASLAVPGDTINLADCDGAPSVPFAALARPKSSPFSSNLSLLLSSRNGESNTYSRRTTCVFCLRARAQRNLSNVNGVCREGLPETRTSGTRIFSRLKEERT